MRQLFAVAVGRDVPVLMHLSETVKKEWLMDRMLRDCTVLQEKQGHCPVLPSATAAHVPGLALPNKVLRKIFIENPKKFLKLN